MSLESRTDHLKAKRKLRTGAPPAEVNLWKRLRDSHLSDAKFRRQYGTDKFVLDFYCSEIKLGIELDGAPDEIDAAVAAFGITVLHFTSKQIFDDIDAVVEKIAERIEELRTG